MSTGDEFTPTSPGELARFLAENARGPKRPIVPVGGRTALHYGFPSAADATLLSMNRLTGTVDYPARDMTVTVEAGVRMDDLAALLAAERQQLPVDVAQSERATLGGAVATNTSGPRRFGYGTLRDYVIGVTAVDAGGRTFHAGGRVVKNVAGYDLCKLLVGSLGTLAVITQLTLKLRPLPETTALLWTTFDAFDDVDVVLERLLTSEARPVAFDVLDPRAASEVAAEARLDLPVDAPVLCIGIEGTAREAAWQIQTLAGELSPFGPREVVTVGEAAPALWAALTEFAVPTDEPLTFRANLLPSRTLEFVERAAGSGVSVQAHAGSGIVTGHLPDEVVSAGQAAEFLTPLRQMAREARGNLVVLRCDDAWKSALPVFGESEPAWPLMRQLKATLDPHNLLNPGRFVDGGSPA